MDNIFKTKLKLVKISSKTEKLTSYFMKIIHFNFSTLMTHE